MGRSASTDLSMGNGDYAILNAVEDTSHIKRGHIFQSRTQIRQEQRADEQLFLKIGFMIIVVLGYCSHLSALCLQYRGIAKR